MGVGGELSASHLLEGGWSTLSKEPTISNVASSHGKHSPELISRLFVAMLACGVILCVPGLSRHWNDACMTLDNLW